MTPAIAFATWEDAVRWLRQQPDRQELVEASYYDDPLIDAATRYWRSEEWRAIREYLPATGGRALDVGAGRGIASFALANEGFNVTALEPDGSDLVGAGAVRSLASISNLPISVIQEFSERLPFADESFDIVFARAVLHHTSDLERACQEYRRVLKRGGRIVAIREHVITRSSDLPAFLKSHPLHFLYGGENAFLKSRYIDALRNAGFARIQALKPLYSPINYAPYTLAGLQQEIVSRLCRHMPFLATPLLSLIRIPPIWATVRQLLSLYDNRPGRLYSFIADVR